MNILGIHGAISPEEELDRISVLGHDACAVLMRDGQLVAAFEEERLNRLKHANCFPVRAIRACLAAGGLTSLDEVDQIGVHGAESAADQMATVNWLLDPTACARHGRTQIAASLARAFGVDMSARIAFCPHHLAHAWSAVVPSGFEESLVFVADGEGDDLCGLVVLARGSDLTILREYPKAISLGGLYTRMISMLGYGRFDEYKAMGLAPYGDPATYASIFTEGVHLLPDGHYDLEPQRNWIARLEQAGLIAQARRKGRPFTQAHMDLAAALQQTLERILIHILTHYRDLTGQRHLCLAGGIAHNCSANGVILASGLFDRVFVQPASHDAGGAYGAAVHAAHAQGLAVPRSPWTHVYFGTDAGSGGDQLATLERWKAFITWEPLGEDLDVPARLVAEGAVIGWVDGRAEFGPRALGHRSILADPRPGENKDRINALVKKREAYRPFAPAVPVERLGDYFDVPGDQGDFPFMTFVLAVRPDMRDRLGAITHVDGTARVQTVSREANPRFWALLHAVGREIGIAMLLNTSFNNNAEPIVDTADDAVACFLTTGLDCLVLGQFLVRKRTGDQPFASHGQLAPRVPEHRRLVRSRRLSSNGRHEERFMLESTRNQSFGPEQIPLSETMYRLLDGADGQRTLSTLLEQSGLTAIPRDTIYGEAERLWQERAIALRPVG